MSRFPLETSLPVNGIGANRGGAIPQTRLQSLTAPGVTPVIVSDRVGQLSSFLRDFTGGAANVANQLARISDQKRQEEEEDNRKYLNEVAMKGSLNQPIPANSLPEVTEVYDRHNAVYFATVEADRVKQEIADGKFNIGIDEDIAAAITRITGEVSANRSDIFRDTFNVAFREQAATMLIAAQQRFKEQTYQSLAAMTPNALASSAEAGVLTAERGKQIVDGAFRQGEAFGKSTAEVIETAIMPGAEAIALRGDTASLEPLMETLTRHDPAKALQLKGRAELVARQNADRARADAFQNAEDFARTGPSFSGYKLFTDGQAKKGAISPGDATRLQNDYLSKELSRAAGEGNVEEARHLVKHLSNAPEAQALGRRAIAAAVDKNRDILTDRIIIDTTGGRMEIAQAAGELRRRLDLWSKNPDDAEAITLDHYQRAANAIITKADKVDKDASVAAYISQTRGRPSTGVRPPIEAIKEGLKLRWMEDNIADFLVTPDGQRIWRGVIDPERAAMDAAEQGGVIAEWRTQIADALNQAQGDSEAVQIAARSYAAIFKSNPTLAAEIRSSLTDSGRLRADVLEDVVTRGPGMGDPVTRAVNEQWVNRIRAAVPDMLRLQPVNLTREQKQTMLFGNAKPEAIDQMIQKDIAAALPPGLDNTTFTFGFGRDVAITRTATATFQQYVMEEVTNQLARGNEAGAVQAAKKKAMDRLLFDHPPILWNQIVTVGPKADYPFTAEYETAMLADIAEAWGEDAPPVSDTHVPVFDKAANGWTLLDMNGIPLSLKNGRPFLWQPAAPKTMKEMMQGVEERARQRRQEWRKSFEPREDYAPVDIFFGF